MSWPISSATARDPTENAWPEATRDSIWAPNFNLGTSVVTPIGPGSGPSPTAGLGNGDPWSNGGNSNGAWPKVPASNNIVERPPGGQILSNGFGSPTVEVCSSCDEKKSATSRCQNCEEDLCGDCVVAHKRVRMTRDHLILPLRTESGKNDHRKPSNGVNGPPPGLALPGNALNQASVAFPGVNPTIPLMSVPSPAVSVANPVSNDDVLRVYATAVEKAKADRDRLLKEAKEEREQIANTKVNIDEMEKRISIKSRTVAQEIKSITEQFVNAIRQREAILLSRLDNVHQVKMEALNDQKKSLGQAVTQLDKVVQTINSCAGNGMEMALIDSCAKAAETLRSVRQECGVTGVTAQEDDLFEFVPPDMLLGSQLKQTGYVGGSGYGPKSYAEGEGLKRAILGKDAPFVVVVKDHLAEPKRSGSDLLKVVVNAPDFRPVRSSIFDCQNGTYRVSWKPNVDGLHSVSVTIKGKHVMNSPFEVRVRTGRSYKNIGKPVVVFSKEGENDGDLCRPWGVCCSPDGLILVANRSNNRIEVFNKGGGFSYHFGVTGKGPGQFDRPASVCIDRNGRVIIADKDNHRIQIFTVEGKFIHMFGEKGSKPGQFNYPWDVATNSNCEILVSDTRNHRIQLFSPTGQWLNKYGFEGQMWKHFDSPRGVCFTADDNVVVTDFNNHRLLVVKSNFQSAQFMGKEGTEDGAFTRPNGVAIDEEGHIIVADSRNDRIQIFTSNGVFVTKFGTKGTGPGEFDRPSGVCISPDGHLIVVDFGNNRVQVF